MITLIIIGIIISIYGIRNVYNICKEQGMPYNPFEASNLVAFVGSFVIPFMFAILFCYLVANYLP